MKRKITAVSLVCLQQSTWSFAPLYKARQPSDTIQSSLSRLNYNPKDNDNTYESYTDDIPPFSKFESESSRKWRMENVRRLQKSLYSHTNQSENHSNLPYGSSIIRNLPALSSEETSTIIGKDITAILPGYQYVWNVHSSEHCHMFHSILASAPRGPWFFACLSSYDTYSDAPRYATLMRITDHRFQDEDGRIVLAVQAMDRLRVAKLSSPHLTFQSGEFHVWPETELVKEKLNGAFLNEQGVCDDHDEGCITFTQSPKLVSQAAISAAAAESYRCRNFEYAPVYLTEKPKGPDDAHSIHNNPHESKTTTMMIEGKYKEEKEEETNKYQTDYLNVIELVTYDAIAYGSLINSTLVNSQAVKNFWKHSNSEQNVEMVDEEVLFCELTKSVLDFQVASFTVDTNQGDENIPDFDTFANAPSIEGVVMMEYHLWKSLDELIRLVNLVATDKVPLSSQLMALLPKRNDWPEEFVLDEFSKSMLSQTGPFVRIDDITKQSRSSVYDSTGYSSLRRALRLSHAVWLLLDGLAVTGVNPPPPTRADVLAIPSIFDRLNEAKRVLDAVNEVLKKLIPHIKNKDSPSETEE